MDHARFPWFFLLPVIAVVGGLAIGAIAIFTEHRRKQALLDERRLMIEKGLTPPPLTDQAMEVGLVPGSRAAIESSLHTGVITVFVGIGLFAAFLVLRYIVGPEGSFVPDRVVSLLGPAGALVSLIGLGNLVYFWIASRRAGAQ